MHILDTNTGCLDGRAGSFQVQIILDNIEYDGEGKQKRTVWFAKQTARFDIHCTRAYVTETSAVRVNEETREQ